MSTGQHCFISLVFYVVRIAAGIGTVMGMPAAVSLVRAKRPQLVGETLRFMQRLWDLTHALNVSSKRMARTLGVTGPQRLVIRVLGQSPEMAASDISRTLGIHPSTLTGILARLQRQGAIERRIDTHDRRRVRFRLTARGVRIDQERKGTVEAAIRRALGRANAATVDTAVRLLDTVTEELGRSG
jgi:DNA-binding MarR family transcriptional regulator